MSRKRKPSRHPNHERWLVSYADFITLLFAFFVVMYATAQVDKQKMNHLATAIQRAFEGMGISSGRRPESNCLPKSDDKLLPEDARVRTIPPAIDTSSDGIIVTKPSPTVRMV